MASLLYHCSLGPTETQTLRPRVQDSEYTGKKKSAHELAVLCIQKFTALWLKRSENRVQVQKLSLTLNGKTSFVIPNVMSFHILSASLTKKTSFFVCIFDKKDSCRMIVYVLYSQWISQFTEWSLDLYGINGDLSRQIVKKDKKANTRKNIRENGSSSKYYYVSSLCLSVCLSPKCVCFLTCNPLTDLHETWYKS